jgi:predicted aspartyl protease
MKQTTFESDRGDLSHREQRARARQKIFASLLGGLALLVALSSGAQVTGTPPVAAVPPQGAAQFLDARKYAEALDAAEKELQKEPGDLGQLTLRMRALIGLGRASEALRIGLPLLGKHPQSPGLRILAGQCAFEQGLVPQAVQIWSALYASQDAEWAARAYRCSISAMLSVGKEAEAQQLVEEALAKWPAPPAELARMALETNADSVAAIKILDRVIASAPGDKEDWEALKQIVAPLKGRFFEESATGDKPLVIPLKEKSERVKVPAWGDGDKYASTVTLSSGSRVTVPAVVNGKKNWMLLDSGSDVALLTNSFAKELGLKPVASAEYLGLGYKGTMKSNWVVVPSMKVGEVEFKNVPAMVIDKDTDFWKELGGILPLSMFRHHALLYDRRHGKLTLYPSGTKAETVLGDKVYPIPSLWFKGKPFVSAKIRDRQNLYFLLDTGASSTYLAAELAGGLGITVNSGKYQSEYSRGMSGGFSSGIAEQVEIGLGTALFKLPLVQVTPIGESYAVSCYGIVGRDILDWFLLYFDYLNNTVAMKAYDR